MRQRIGEMFRFGERSKQGGGFEFTKIEDEHNAAKAEHLTVVYGGGEKAFEAVKDISLEIPKGQFLAIVGKSGSGKTTLIMTLAGLSIEKDGKPIKDIHASGKVNLPGRMRFVFQNFSMWPHLNVRQHLDLMYKGEDFPYAKKLKKQISPLATEIEIAEMMDLLGLEKQANKYGDQMSGGEKRRVGFATQLMADADTLFMDEPFSSLDTETKEDMHELLLKVREHDHRKTMVMVTHDLREALLLSERIAIMKEGKITDDVKVPFPYPRDVNLKYQPELIEIEKRLSKTL